MRKLPKAIAGIAAASVLALTGTAVDFPAVNSSTVNAAVDGNNDDWLHAEGSRLYDMNGNEVWLTGANWFGMNCTENIPHGLYATDLDKLLENVSRHGINIIRFPVSTELLLSWMDGEPLPVSSVNASYNPPQDVIGEDGTVTKAGTYGDVNRYFVESDGKTLKNSMEIFDVIMSKCKEYGIKALIDVHSPAAHNSGHNYTLWYYQDGAEDADNMAVGHFSKKEITWDDWINSITWLAEKYANDDTIIAYDLKNEPHGKRGYSGTTCPDTIAKWDDSTDKNNWKYSAEQCANSILKVNPNALILIEGIEQSPITEKGYTFDTPDAWEPKEGEEKWYGAWWGGNLRGVKTYPVKPTSGTSQIVYSPHDYGPKVYPQTWFKKNFTTETLLNDYWHDSWAYINEEDIAPLLIGEWGGMLPKGVDLESYINGDASGWDDLEKNARWMILLRDYMIKNHINHTFWCLNPNSGDTEGLLDSQFENWDMGKYNLMEQSLWQTQQTGKYIGLDHQIPLGVNGTGLSLNDFYSNYASTEGSNLDGGTVVGGTPVITTPTSGTTTVTITTRSTTTTSVPTETTTTTSGSTSGKYLAGDANEDGDVNMADAVAIMRSQADPDEFSLTAQGKANADVVGNDGVTNADALTIQQYEAGIVTKLPVTA
ncbi:MAG: cellulase family glycosylhydrolase [Ruminococcus sp.]|nr:cellulase family glycosylhydrolase [Ruminococcus sp.]